MDYEKKYNEALDRAKKYKLKEDLIITQDIFPELKESEDDKMRDDIIATINLYYGEPLEEEAKEMIAWLEKQKAKEDLDRMAPIYEDLESFESALEKAWKFYNDSGARTVDSCEDDYVECAHAKGFREGFLSGLKRHDSGLPAGFYLVDEDGHQYYSKEFRYNNGTFITKMKVKEEQKPSDMEKSAGRNMAEQMKEWQQGYSEGFKDGCKYEMWKHLSLPSIPSIPSPYQPFTPPVEPYYWDRVTCTTTTSNNEEHHEEEK